MRRGPTWVSKREVKSVSIPDILPDTLAIRLENFAESWLFSAVATSDADVLVGRWLFGRLELGFADLESLDHFLE
jgi:hypothetical protein